MKKNFLLILISILGIGFVSAVLIGYYSLFSTTFNVKQPIQVTGNLTQTVENVLSGDTFRGNVINISNIGTSKRNLNITDNSPECITTRYIGSTTLIQKVVNFTKTVWEIKPNAENITVDYILIGNNFTTNVTRGAKAGYILIYYKDNSNRFASPANAIKVEDVVGNLPYENDKNLEEYNYCNTGEYSTCHGAKIWYVPLNATNEGGNLDWNRASEFFYETELIQFNSEGKITIYPNTTTELIPEYSVYSYGCESNYTIITKIA
ncbi:MAG: hypothetical protein Q8N99_07255 [Nanoarchaeota archaeon]|nr:hypothetical protein [Nanoarchaeota archaeon]